MSDDDAILRNWDWAQPSTVTFTAEDVDPEVFRTVYGIDVGVDNTSWVRASAHEDGRIVIEEAGTMENDTNATVPTDDWPHPNTPEWEEQQRSRPAVLGVRIDNSGPRLQWSYADQPIGQSVSPTIDPDAPGITIHLGGNQWFRVNDDQRDLGGLTFAPMVRASIVARLRALADMIEASNQQD